MTAPEGVAAYNLGRRLKWRVAWTSISFGAVFGAAFWQRTAIFLWLLIPGGGNLSPHGGMPIVTGISDMAGLTLGLAAKCGVIAVVLVSEIGLFTLMLPPIRSRAPWVPSRLRPLLWIAMLPVDIWTDLRAAFATPARRFVFLAMISVNVCFLGGAAFAYYVMTPVGIPFLLRFGDELVVPVITFASYMDFLLSMMWWLGVIFELPPAMYLLARFRSVPYWKFRKLRKWIPLTALIFGAVITPDVGGVTMFMVAVPIWLLYEVGLFFAWLAHREEDEYLFARKIGRTLRRLYTLPALAWSGLAYVPAMAWRRLRRWRGRARG